MPVAEGERPVKRLQIDDILEKENYRDWEADPWLQRVLGNGKIEDLKYRRFFFQDSKAIMGNIIMVNKWDK